MYTHRGIKPIDPNRPNQWGKVFHTVHALRQEGDTLKAVCGKVAEPDWEITEGQDHRSITCRTCSKKIEREERYAKTRQAQAR